MHNKRSEYRVIEFMGKVQFWLMTVFIVLAQLLLAFASAVFFDNFENLAHAACPCAGISMAYLSPAGELTLQVTWGMSLPETGRAHLNKTEFWPKQPVVHILLPPHGTWQSKIQRSHLFDSTVLVPV